MVAGNKSDLATSHREIALEDVSTWLHCDLPKMRAKVFECSAKNDHNVSLLFKTLLQLSRVSVPVAPDGGTGTAVAAGSATANEAPVASGGFKRRSSAYVSATSKGRSWRCVAQVSGHPAYMSFVACLGKGRVNSPSLSTHRPDLLADTGNSSGGGGPAAEAAKLKPRSRSLIRRSSRKTKQQIANTNSEDCNVQ